MEGANDASRSKLETDASIATTSISTSDMQIVFAAKELSRQFDAIENAIDALHDSAARTRLRQSTKQSRDALLKELHNLSRQIQSVFNPSGS
jgi:hypothetical protein